MDRTQVRSAVIAVRGAREHNLRDVDVDLPRDAFVVITGVSGSGKSSLAFSTVYAEAQARFLDSVSPYARRLIDQVGAPRVRSITGLPPAVALQQSRGTPGSRSTVGTVTTLSNTLRMLVSRAGTYPAGVARLDSDAFSPNSPAGACPRCHGLGIVHTATESSLVPDPSLSIRERAVAAWPGAWQGKNYRDILATLGHDVDQPWRDLPAADREWILFTDDAPVVTVHAQREAHRIQRPYQGTYQSARRYVLHTLATTASASLRRRALRHVETDPCSLCHGAGLRPEALRVTFAGRTIHGLTSMSLASLEGELRATDPADAVVASLVPDLLTRLGSLLELGLGHLSMSRRTPTLSAGELQRMRLATALASPLFGVVYVLDEPSAGLHPADAASLLSVLHRVRASGNSLLVIEHDVEMMRHADWLVELGPGAGVHGGRVLHSGPPAGLESVEGSPTRAALFPTGDVAGSRGRHPTGRLRLRGVTRHNLDGLDVDFPLGVLTVVTGVSGSGKTTLVAQVLADTVRRHLGDDDEPASGEDEDERDEDGSAASDAEGLQAVERLVQVDQRPIGRTPRSNLATYTGLFDGVRRLFAAADLARERGYGVGRFSFNVAGGRCANCQGEGSVAVELLFLPGTYAPCPVCLGARYRPDTLEVTVDGRSIADVLALTVDDATSALADAPALARGLRALQEVGLGYLTLGQPATELSGGEAQRIKLARELQKPTRGHTLYLLDEPTTGLHPADVARLMSHLQALVDTGNTVVVVEHDLDVIAVADHVIDIGPGGGAAGGRIVAVGRPADVAAARDSRTGTHLAARLSRSTARRASPRPAPRTGPSP